jgi:transcription initiation factor TFIIH subunit 2
MSTSAGTVAAGGKTDDGAHTWENVGAAAWTAMSEDADGNLVAGGQAKGTSTIADLVRNKRRQRTRYDAAGGRRVVRDMIRYLYVVLDFSSCMATKDTSIGKGLRFQSTTNLAMLFVSDYFDQNPISHLGVIVAKDGQAELITQLSGNSKVHIRALQHLAAGGGSGIAAEGEFSLQNSLEVAGRSLGHMPKYGSREILVVTGSLATCDPGDLLMETVRTNCKLKCLI